MKEETNKKLDEIIETANRDIESAEKTLEKGEKKLKQMETIKIEKWIDENGIAHRMRFSCGDFISDSNTLLSQEEYDRLPWYTRFGKRNPSNLTYVVSPTSNY